MSSIPPCGAYKPSSPYRPHRCNLPTRHDGDHEERPRQPYPEVDIPQRWPQRQDPHDHTP